MTRRAQDLLRRARRCGRSADGFNLVILMVSVTILNVLLALAIPAYSMRVQREKEAKLIFRGLQYAEAIRVFQLRHNRLPNQLRELVEVQPRSIRQLWHNPMTEDGSWLLLPAQGQGQNLQNQNRNQNRNQNQNRNRQNQGRGQQRGPQAIRVIPPRPGELNFAPQVSMPFAGVASPEGESGFRSFMGSEEIKEWRFTVEMVSGTLPVGDGSMALPVSSASFWKPFPPGVTPPNQLAGGGQQSGARNGQGQSPGLQRGGQNSRTQPATNLGGNSGQRPSTNGGSAKKN